GHADQPLRQNHSHGFEHHPRKRPQRPGRPPVAHGTGRPGGGSGGHSPRRRRQWRVDTVESRPWILCSSIRITDLNGNGGEPMGTRLARCFVVVGPHGVLIAGPSGSADAPAPTCEERVTAAYRRSTSARAYDCLPTEPRMRPGGNLL